MADGGSLYRQQALERLASPEQLDTLMQIKDARSWLALCGCGIVIASALAWGLSGSVPTKQAASGILIYSEGLADVASVATGQITAIEVDAGDRVQKGQLIARVAQPGLQAELSGLRAQRRELQLAYEKGRELEGQDVQLRGAATAQARTALTAAIASTRQRARELQERSAAQQRLYERGLVTKETLLATQDALRTAQSSLQSMSTDLQQLEVARLAAARVNDVERRQNEAKVQDSERQIQLVEQRLQEYSRIVSAYDGRVVEVRALVGDVIEPGQPVVSIERSADRGTLEALLYVDSRQGKRIKPGMRVEISPTTARRERYGVLRGQVRAVEAFPSTRRGMVRVLHNEQLVDTFLGETQGVPTALRVRLLLDPSSASGYRWSSRRGSTLRLSSGTRCTASVITGTQRPLTLLFPTFEAVL
jgi:HlyD family secretion protein